MLIEAVLKYIAARRQFNGKRGPMGMRANARRRPQPYAKTPGGTRIMLPRLIYKPLTVLVNKMK